MKKEITAIIILLLLVSGCSGRRAAEERIAQAKETLAADPAEAERILYGLSSSRAMDEVQRADVARLTAMARLRQGKTYLLEDGLEQAIAYYRSQADTAALLSSLQLAFIRERWRGEQDSAAMFLREAIDYATDSAQPRKSALCIELSNLYAQPLLPKDYRKAISYAREALAYPPLKGRALHDIGLFYDFLDEPDSAKAYMEEALEITSPQSEDFAQFALNYAGNRVADPVKARNYLAKIEGPHLGKLITLGFMSVNEGKTSEANGYLAEATKMYEASPESYSVNTYNGLRLLKGCVDYARHGHVDPGEGTVVNDSIGEQLSLSQRLASERSEHDTRLRIRLLVSETKRQQGWIVSLSVIIVVIVVAAWLLLRHRHRYMRLRRELEEMRLNQIVSESEEGDDSTSFAYIAGRAALCVDRFRQSGGMAIIQRGEALYDADHSFLPVKERAEVRNMLLECFADFIVDLRIDAGKLTMEDIVTCLLSVMRLGNAAIASCLGATDGAVRTRKTRLRSRMSPEMVALVFG